MKESPTIIPVVLFVYIRLDLVRKVLDCLRENHIPLLIVYSDGAHTPADVENVAAVRSMIRAINWCEARLIERPTNLGLGANVLAGISEVARAFPAFLVWEDDLVCLPGTYRWICEALRYYEKDTRVMSVSAWTHEKVIPAGTGGRPYFDGRAECWIWGTWARAWQGMEDETAAQKLGKLRERGVPADTYGSDLPAMAKVERRKNIWAVRWIYHHLEHAGLCLRPPHAFSQHLGVDARATNAGAEGSWENAPITGAVLLPEVWPEPRENPQCQELWRAAYPRVSLLKKILKKMGLASGF